MASKESAEKLNIAMLGHKRIPSREGGIEIVVEELSKRMAARGHNFCFWCKKQLAKFQFGNYLSPLFVA